MSAILQKSDSAIHATSFIQMHDVHKDYISEQGHVQALRGTDLQIAQGEFVAIVGPSGCGKSTLLNLLGGIDSASSGELIVNGWDLRKFNEPQLTEYRRHGVGIIFQFFNLLPLLSALENILLPVRLSGGNRAAAQKMALEMLEQVGLKEKINQPSNHLSGGEMQRVALVRALINEPKLLLADEPTGNLDSVSAEGVIKVLLRLSKERGTTVVMVTHSESAAAVADRVLRMRDGVFIH